MRSVISPQTRTVAIPLSVSALVDPRRSSGPDVFYRRYMNLVFPNVSRLMCFLCAIPLLLRASVCLLSQHRERIRVIHSKKLNPNAFLLHYPHTSRSLGIRDCARACLIGPRHFLVYIPCGWVPFPIRIGFLINLIRSWRVAQRRRRPGLSPARAWFLPWSTRDGSRGPVCLSTMYESCICAGILFDMSSFRRPATASFFCLSSAPTSKRIRIIQRGIKLQRIPFFHYLHTSQPRGVSDCV